MTTKQSILSRLSEAVHGSEKDLFTQDQLNSYAEYYVNIFDEETCNDEIVSTFLDYYWTTEHAVRRCSACGKLMRKGYCISDGEYYYCSDECLHEDMPEEEYNKLYEDDLAYWTEW